MPSQNANSQPVNRPKDDFFVTYTEEDEGWATWISWWLERVQYRVIYAKWDFRPGENFVLRMNDAARNARKTIMVLSEKYLEAHFIQPEWASRFASDPTGMGKELIPIRVKPCTPTGLLKPLIFIDLVGVESELEAVITLLSGIIDASGRTTAKPHFPPQTIARGTTSVPGSGGLP
jgi:TIR domain-containing protein